MKKSKLIYIEWEDAVGTSSQWTSVDSIKERHKTSNRIRQVGWVIVEDKKKVTLMASLDGRENATDGASIPKSLIRKRRVIKL